MKLNKFGIKDSKNHETSFVKVQQTSREKIEVKFMADKKFWRCNVCNDIHYGAAGPELCPTCQNKNAYAEIDLEEAKNVMGL